jgi:hypothetical protein
VSAGDKPLEALPETVCPQCLRDVGKPVYMCDACSEELLADPVVVAALDALAECIEQWGGEILVVDNDKLGREAIRRFLGAADN